VVGGGVGEREELHMPIFFSSHTQQLKQIGSYIARCAECDQEQPHWVRYSGSCDTLESRYSISTLSATYSWEYSSADSSVCSWLP